MQSIKNFMVCGYWEGKRDFIVNKFLNVFDGYYVMDINDGVVMVNFQYSVMMFSISDWEGKNVYFFLNYCFNRSYKVSCGNVRKYCDDFFCYYFVGKSQLIISVV